MKATEQGKATLGGGTFGMEEAWGALMIGRGFCRAVCMQLFDFGSFFDKNSGFRS